MDRHDPPFNASERETLLGYLDYHRATLMQKVAGLDDAQLRTPFSPSTMTLGGMVKHLALVEVSWCCHRILGEPEGEPWDSVDWQSDWDWDWHSAEADSRADLLALWEVSVERARGALAGVDLDQPTVVGLRSGEHPSVRWVLVHLIEEYARHNGHADLIREHIDGTVGE